MSDITPFHFPDDGREIRVVIVAGDPWFVAVDVATSLGYGNPRQAVSTHVDDDDRSTVQSLDGGPDRTIVNESGLYALIFGSRLPSARAFKRWVTSEVLPALRRGEMRPPAAGDALSHLATAKAIIAAIEADHARLNELSDRTQVVESQLAGVLGHYDEFTTLGYAKLKGLPTDRGFLIRLGQRAAALMRAAGAEPRKRQDVSFGKINVYPVTYLEAAYATM